MTKADMLDAYRLATRIRTTERDSGRSAAVGRWIYPKRAQNIHTPGPRELHSFLYTTLSAFSAFFCCWSSCWEVCFSCCEIVTLPRLPTFFYTMSSTDHFPVADDFQRQSDGFMQWLSQQPDVTISPKIQVRDLRHQGSGRGVGTFYMIFMFTFSLVKLFVCPHFSN